MAGSGSAVPKAFIAQFPKRKVKEIVTILSQHCPIEAKDVLEPTAERTLEIMWNIACYVYNEDIILDQSRGFSNKRLVLAKLMRKLLDTCCLPPPSLDVMDLIQPQKQRMVVIYSAIVHFIIYRESQLNVKERMTAEKNELLDMKDRMQMKISDRLEELAQIKNSTEQKRVTFAELASEHEAQYKECQDLKILSEEKQAGISSRKKLLEGISIKMNDAEGKFVALQEEITRLQQSIYPPRSELEQLQSDLESKLRLQQETLKIKQLRLRQFSTKAQQAIKDKKAVEASEKLLQQLTAKVEKNRRETDECLMRIEMDRQDVITQSALILETQQKLAKDESWMINESHRLKSARDLCIEENKELEELIDQSTSAVEGLIKERERLTGVQDDLAKRRKKYEDVYVKEINRRKHSFAKLLAIVQLQQRCCKPLIS